MSVPHKILFAWCCYTLAHGAMADQPRLPQRDFTGETARHVLAIHAVDEIEVDLDGVRVRVKLAGVAGTGDGAASKKEAPEAARARVFLDNLLRGEAVYIEQEPETESRSRRKSSNAGIRALLYRAPDGLCVNLELIRQGHARHDARQRHRHLAVFAYYAAAAREHERGLWNPKAAPVTTTDQPPTSEGGNGAATQPAKPDTETQSNLVWITKTGKRYHTQDCFHHRGGDLTITRDEARQRGLRPCTHCKPD